MQQTIRAYYTLTKPGIIYGNVMTTAAGFLLASRGDVDVRLLLATLVGTSLVIAAGCVINCYIDRGIDQKMARTKNRPLVNGQISAKSAIIYASCLALAGFTILALFTNALTVLIGLVGLFFYVVMYSIWKRRSVYGTIVGSVSGATPIVAGYTAASGNFDMGALLLFLILTFWQMPHFYSIAIYRRKDYAAAGLPVLPVKQGIPTAKIHIVLYIGAFIAACAALTALDYAGLSYLFVMMLLGGMWLGRGIQGFYTNEDTQWARRMFFFSLIVITSFSIMLSLDAILP